MKDVVYQKGGAIKLPVYEFPDARHDATWTFRTAAAAVKHAESVGGSAFGAKTAGGEWTLITKAQGEWRSIAGARLEDIQKEFDWKILQLLHERAHERRRNCPDAVLDKLMAEDDLRAFKGIQDGILKLSAADTLVENGRASDVYREVLECGIPGDPLLGGEAIHLADWHYELGGNHGGGIPMIAVVAEIRTDSVAFGDLGAAEEAARVLLDGAQRWRQSEPLRSFAATALTDFNGKVVGTLGIVDKMPAAQAPHTVRMVLGLSEADYNEGIDVEGIATALTDIAALIKAGDTDYALFDRSSSRFAMIHWEPMRPELVAEIRSHTEIDF